VRTRDQEGAALDPERGQDRLERSGFSVGRRQAIDNRQRAVRGVAGERGAESEALHLPGKPTRERMWFGPESHATTDLVGGADGALARAAEALLLANLHRGAANFATALGACGTRAAVRHLGHISLVKNGPVGLDAEDVIGGIDLAQFLAGGIDEGKLHFDTFF